MSTSPKQDTLSTSAVIASPADDDAIAPESSSPRPLSLGDMPKEVVVKIIENTMPEGFESLALTCKGFHKHCTPYIEHHNMLCGQFKNFSFMGQSRLSRPINHSYSLLERIAAEPIVGRYIQHIDMASDSPAILPDTQIDVEAPDGDGPLVALFTNSRYLQRANLDGRQYYSLVAQDYSNSTSDGRYMSSHAVAFLLTLLPNLRSLRVFWYWAPTGMPDKLVNTIISEARKPHSPQQHGASLAQLTRLDFQVMGNPLNLCLIDQLPFLALPRLRSFHQKGLRTHSIHHGNLTHNQLQDHFGEMLENVYITSGTMECGALAEFLRLTPRLKTFYFDWDQIHCNVTEAVENLGREAGARMETLALLSLRCTLGGIIRPMPSFRRFQVLRELQLSFDFFCHILSFTVGPSKAIWCATGKDLETKQLRLVDILPASLTRLYILYDQPKHRDIIGWAHPFWVDHNLLQPFFHGFVELKDVRLPALETIGLGFRYPFYAEMTGYLDELLEKTKAVNVYLELDFPELCFNWDDARWALMSRTTVGF